MAGIIYIAERKYSKNGRLFRDVYIGFASVRIGESLGYALARRRRSHAFAMKKGKTLFHRSLRKYKKFQWRVIDFHPDALECLNVLEPAWIRKYRGQLDVRMMNLTDGGEGAPGRNRDRHLKIIHLSDRCLMGVSEIAEVLGIGRSTVTRVLARESSLSLEDRRRLGYMARRTGGRILSNEARKKISRANLGRKPSPETRERISEGVRRSQAPVLARRKREHEDRERLIMELENDGVRWVGRRLSPEHRKRLSELAHRRKEGRYDEQALPDRRHISKPVSSNI
ncbi:MAG: helix-turn-helix domain-containing protein [Dehalococcoidia bacterium]|nr:helix-turn-helix domain-containing protein [Dehalococcoidia bacterium]